MALLVLAVDLLGEISLVSDSVVVVARASQSVFLGVSWLDVLKFCLYFRGLITSGEGFAPELRDCV